MKRIAPNFEKSSNIIVLDRIPIDLNVETIFARIRAQSKNPRVQKIIRHLISLAEPITRAKSMFRVSSVNALNGDAIEISGVRLTSHVLSVAFRRVDKVYPFVATCGVELDNIQVGNDLLEKYCLDLVKRAVLTSTMHYLESFLSNNYGLSCVSRFSPGDLATWPINQQKEIFSLLGDVDNTIGVKLTSGCMMVPEKSISGIYFPTAEKFESCQLCKRKCADRQSPFDIGIAKKLEVA